MRVLFFVSSSQVIVRLVSQTVSLLGVVVKKKGCNRRGGRKQVTPCLGAICIAL